MHEIFTSAEILMMENQRLYTFIYMPEIPVPACADHLSSIYHVMFT